MNTLAQVQENVLSAGRSGVGSLTPSEMELVLRVARAYVRPPIPCTRCHYCMPCPHLVNITANLHIWNKGVMGGDMKTACAEYHQMRIRIRASECAQCLACEEICPQKIKVSEWMTLIDHEFGRMAASTIGVLQPDYA